MRLLHRFAAELIERETLSAEDIAALLGPDEQADQSSRQLAA
jgi:hypothetical protein